MWVRATVPDFGPDGRASVARIHAAEGDRLAPGGLLLDLDVDLSGGIARDCPPVSTCRIVLREALWLRRLHVGVGAALAPGAPLADLADTPDAAYEPPMRAARIATAAIVHHPDWWGAEG